MINEAFEQKLKNVEEALSHFKDLKIGKSFTEGCRSYVTHEKKEPCKMLDFMNSEEEAKQAILGKGSITVHMACLPYIEASRSMINDVEDFLKENHDLEIDLVKYLSEKSND